MKLLLGFAAAMTMMASSANAYIVTPTVGFNNTTTLNAPAITGFPTLANQMVGIQVTANFVGGGSSGPLSWASMATNPGANIGNIGGVTDAVNGWSLIVNGDTFASGNCPASGPPCGGIWELTNSAGSGKTISSIAINLITPGGMTDFAFDVSPQGGADGGPEHSPNSADGNAFGNRGAAGLLGATYFNSPYTVLPYATEITGAQTPGITATATYSNPLTIGGLFYADGQVAGSITDEYTFLTIAFGGTPGGLTAGNIFRFQADTDQLTAEVIVPEPMTIALFGTGLLGLGALRRLRRKGRK